MKKTTIIPNSAYMVRESKKRGMMVYEVLWGQTNGPPDVIGKHLTMAAALAHIQQHQAESDAFRQRQAEKRRLARVSKDK